MSRCAAEKASFAAIGIPFCTIVIFEKGKRYLNLIINQQMASFSFWLEPSRQALKARFPRASNYLHNLTAY
jgi:hypothetical protein